MGYSLEWKVATFDWNKKYIHRCQNPNSPGSRQQRACKFSRPEMVNYLLMVVAELENLTNLEPEGGCDDPNFSYLFKVSPIFILGFLFPAASLKSLSLNLFLLLRLWKRFIGTVISLFLFLFFFSRDFSLDYFSITFSRIFLYFVYLCDCVCFGIANWCSFLFESPLVLDCLLGGFMTTVGC